MKMFRFLPALLAALCFTLPTSAFSRDKVKIYRDLDGDGHYNKKTYDVGRRHGSSRHYRPHYYGSRYRPYYHRPHYYGYGYYPRTSFGVTVTRPSYYATEVYRGRAGYNDDLASDVQVALRRRGYYRGAIDGDIGPGSRSAIRAYQSDRGLAVTGRIDSALLRSLGIG